MFLCLKIGSLKWLYKTGNPVISSPKIGLDGTVYVGSVDNYLYAITSTGKGFLFRSYIKFIFPFFLGSLIWFFQTSDWISSSPALGQDGSIYVGSYDCYLYSISSTGSVPPSISLRMYNIWFLR